MIFNIVAGLALTGTLATAPVVRVDFTGPITTVTPMPPSPMVRRQSGLPLGDVAQPVYDTDFVTQGYFSAFALSKDGGYGYAVNANSLGAARDMALMQCLDQNESCLIVADIIPQGYRPPAIGEVFLNPEIGAYYFSPGPEVNGMRAMAISEDGAWAFNWGYTTQGEADAAALQTCQDNRSMQLPTEQDWPCFLVPGAGQ